MKKSLITLSVFLLPSMAMAATVTPRTYSSYGDVINVTMSAGEAFVACLPGSVPGCPNGAVHDDTAFDGAGTPSTNWPVAGTDPVPYYLGDPSAWGNGLDNTFPTWHILVFTGVTDASAGNNPYDNCSPNTYENCVGSASQDITITFQNTQVASVFSALSVFSSTTQAAAVGNVSLSTVTSIDSIWTLVVIALGIPLAFYVIESVIQLMSLDRGKSVKNINRLTAYMDRRRQSRIRQAWRDDANG